MDKIIEELTKYVELSGDEWGEYCSNLIGLYTYSTDFSASKSFIESVEYEIKDQLESIKKGWEIVKYTKTTVDSWYELEEKYNE